MRAFCAITLMLAASVVAPVPSARADTCQVHYTLCVNKYGNEPKACACARSLCLKKVGNADAGPKWNWIPGINDCLKK
jgi:hypothetical protein